MITISITLLIALTLCLGCRNNPDEAARFEAARARQAVPPPIELTPAEVDVLTAGDPEALPDARRRAIIKIALSDVGHEPVYVDFFRAIIQLPATDATVAAACAAALARHGQPGDTRYITPLLQTNDPFARWQTAVSLQRLHNPDAIPALINTLGNDDDPDPRAAAADALAQYTRRDVFTALVQALNDSDSGVTRAAHAALQTLTGQTLPDDPRDWLQLADDNPQSLFQNAQPYTYKKYPDRPGFLSLFQFDSDPPTNTPKGYTAPM